MNTIDTGLPDSNPKTRYGISKPGIFAIPVVGMLHCGMAMAEGRRKYALHNWRDAPITASVYYDAIMRHMFLWHAGQETDPATAIRHLGYVMANCAILLDADAMGTLIDDRKKDPVMVEALMRQMSDTLTQQARERAEAEERARRDTERASGDTGGSPGAPAPGSGRLVPREAPVPATRRQGNEP